MPTETPATFEAVLALPPAAPVIKAVWSIPIWAEAVCVLSPPMAEPDTELAWFTFTLAEFCAVFVVFIKMS